MASSVTVYAQGSAKGVTLGANEHLATGGEGSVYAKGNRVFKVYLDPDKAIRAGVDRKVSLLSQLRHPGVAAPSGVLMDKAGKFIGIEMPRIQGEPLCKLYPSIWWQSQRFTVARAEQVAQSMRAVVDFAHKNKALMVDANELNWLVHADQAVAIDVDSWQLGGFRATAIMPSIEDPLANGHFTPGSDWFAWAVVSFQLWCGIHPYKGSHPDFARSALKERMQARVSVFDAQTRMPAAARAIDSIPSSLRAWYEEVFEKGYREAPPLVWGKVAVKTASKSRQKTAASTGMVKREPYCTLPGTLVAVLGEFLALQGPAGLCLWDLAQRKVLNWVSSSQVEKCLFNQAAVLRYAGLTVLVELDAQAVRLFTQDGFQAQVDTVVTKLWQSGSRLFGVQEGVPYGLLELEPARWGERWLVGVVKSWPVSALSTRFFNRGWLQDCLGTPFLGVATKDGIQQAKALELTGFKVLDAVFLSDSCVAVAGLRRRDGERVLLMLELNAAGIAYEVVSEDVVDETALNAVQLSSGLSVMAQPGNLILCKDRQRKQVSVVLGAGASLVAVGARLGLVNRDNVELLSLGA